MRTLLDITCHANACHKHCIAQRLRIASVAACACVPAMYFNEMHPDSF
jgi:hypothetical protein